MGDGLRRPATDETADVVARFYDEHPYPPPATDLARAVEGWDDDRRRVEHHRVFPTRSFRPDPSILVAGCGTSQAARYAIRWPRARVVGIDVSPAAVTHSTALADRHALTNLDVRELPIERADELAERFDLVVCTGVLHHLVDPARGLRALRAVLAPDGAVHLMVYAPYGRTGVYLLQEYCRRLGVRPTPAELDDLQASLREVPLAHPVSHLLRETPDFGHRDALADALLNPRDQAFSAPEVFGLLDDAGLRFLRWLRQAPYLPWCGVLREIPHHARLAVLEPQEQYAAAELFRGTMTRHSVIATSADRSAERGVRFDGDGWRDHVPLRESTVRVVEDRLPPGVAAVVLNHAHTDTDLVSFLDPQERQWFEAINGRRSVGDIGGPVEWWRGLWHHDLVVFDATASG